MEKKFCVNNLIGSIRPDFDKEGLLDENIPADPFSLFETWLHTALDEGDQHANAMTLSTIGTNGIPDARVVLLRNLSYGGLTFYTNYNSKKGSDLAAHPNACLLFFLERTSSPGKGAGRGKAAACIRLRRLLCQPAF